MWQGVSIFRNPPCFIFPNDGNGMFVGWGVGETFHSVGSNVAVNISPRSRRGPEDSCHERCRIKRHAGRKGISVVSPAHVGNYTFFKVELQFFGRQGMCLVVPKGD